ncbi:MAG: LPS assembly lipoprotein LptE [Pseudomonadota bacterium]|nr:LPS assembly lipoprotein LptE [Pseudomonadota bacterium]
MTRAHALAVALLLSLSGCGLRPMYAGGASGPVATSLSTISVAPIPERGGWLVRNALVDRLGGENPGATHRLEVELDDDISGLGIRGDRSVTRERRTLRARYRLVRISTGLVVLDATAGSDAGIDVVSSPYATIVAEQSALERLAKQIADQMVSRLALYAVNRPITP